MEISPTDLVDLAKGLGVTGLLIFALIGGFRQWWVFGWVHKEVVKERDEWKRLALDGTRLSENAIQTAKKVASETSSQVDDQ